MARSFMTTLKNMIAGVGTVVDVYPRSYVMAPPEPSVDPFTGAWDDISSDFSRTFQDLSDTWIGMEAKWNELDRLNTLNGNFHSSPK